MVTSIKAKAAEHPIKSVTVFKSSKAEIVRTFALSLEAGQNQIEISGLSSAIDTESARVSGLGDARLFDVVCIIDSQKSVVALVDADLEAIRILETKKQELESEKAIVEEQAHILSNYAKTLKGEDVSPQDMGVFLQSFITQKKASLRAFTELDEKILDLERQIAKEQERLAMRKGKAEAKVSAVIVAQTAGPVKLSLTYIVSNARWEPTYDLHATTENGKTSTSVSLHYRAKISQTTGEDWRDTALILSTTATETMMGGIPPLQNLNLTVMNKMFDQQTWRARPAVFPAQGQLPPPPPERRCKRNSEQVPAGSDGALRSISFGAASRPLPSLEADTSSIPEDEWDYEEEIATPELQPVAEGVALVNKSPLSVSYTVEGSSTIPSDGELHKVSVAVLPFEANVTWVTMPRQKAVVYMQSAVKNNSDYRLLPGPVSVFLDNSYVSKTSISDINSGDTFECTFGVDISTRVSYTRTSKFVRDPATPFAEQFKTTTFTSTTKLSNQHSFPIFIVSKDAVPLCDDKRIKVILRKPQELIDAKDQTVDLQKEHGIKVKWGKSINDKGGEKEGKFEWVGTIAGGKDVVLVTEWEVKSPVDVDWLESAAKSHRSG